MKSTTTNVLLGIIAINLTLLTVVQLNIWPKTAKANELHTNMNYGVVPLNEDGSIDVLLNTEQISQLTPQQFQFPDEIAVDLRSIAGHDVAFTLGGRYNNKAILWSYTEESNLR